MLSVSCRNIEKPHHTHTRTYTHTRMHACTHTQLASENAKMFMKDVNM